MYVDQLQISRLYKFVQLGENRLRILDEGPACTARPLVTIWLDSIRLQLDLCEDRLAQFLILKVSFLLVTRRIRNVFIAERLHLLLEPFRQSIDLFQRSTQQLDVRRRGRGT